VSIVIALGLLVVPSLRLLVGLDIFELLISPVNVEVVIVEPEIAQPVRLFNEKFLIVVAVSVIVIASGLAAEDPIVVIYPPGGGPLGPTFSVGYNFIV